MYIGKSVDGKSSAWAPSRENDISWKPFMEEMYENHSRAVRRRSIYVSIYFEALPCGVRYRPLK